MVILTASSWTDKKLNLLNKISKNYDTWIYWIKFHEIMGLTIIWILKNVPYVAVLDFCLSLLMS